jgi:DNA-binding MarR family transcriptional regulator
MPRPISRRDYELLAEIRYQIRRFVNFSEDAARAAGVEPQQHQLLLAIKGLPAGEAPTIRACAERLQIRHHSAVELVNRAEQQGLVQREPSATDRRAVSLSITARGERSLHDLTVAHRKELHAAAPSLVRALTEIIQEEGAPRAPRKESDDVGS